MADDHDGFELLATADHERSIYCFGYDLAAVVLSLVGMQRQGISKS